MATTDIRALSDEQLVHAELQLERDMIAASFRLRTGQLEDTASLGRMRRQIARVRTQQRQRELEQGLAKDSLRNLHRATFQPSAGQEQGGEGSGGFLKGIVDKIGGKD